MPPNFAEKTFADGSQTSKSAKVFSFKSFPLYGNVREICSKIYNCSVNLHRRGRCEMVIEAGMSANFLICMMLYNVTSITININSP